MSFETTIPDNHPSLEGHFPGNPIVPGVVVLDEVISALKQWQSKARCIGFTAVKFNSPLLPGQSFSVDFTEMGSRRVKFNCKKSSDDSIFASGQVKLADD